jgi:HEAT repeat protein
MRSRRLLIVAALPGLGLIVALCVAQWSTVLTGWLHGEALYHGLPTSFWLSSLKSQDIGERRQATIALVQIGRPALPGLINVLSDPSWQARAAAGVALAEMGAEARDAVPALRDRLRADGWIAALLRRMGDEAVLGLAESLQDESVSVRRDSATALYQLGGAARMAAPALGEALRDKDEQVREEALAALWVIGPDAVPVLITALQTAQVPDRKKIPAALVQPALVDDRTARALCEAIRDDAIRLEAIEAVAALYSVPKDAVPALIESLEVQDRPIQRAAASTLARMGHAAAGAVPELAHIFRSGDAETRRVAANALGSMGGNALDLLAESLSDKERRLDAMAGLARAWPRNQSSTSALCAALKDSDVAVRSAAAEALAGTDAHQAVPALIMALDDEDKDVRTRAAWALGTFRAEARSAAPALWRMLNHPDIQVRRRAIWCLTMIGAEDEQVSLLVLTALRERRVSQAFFAFLESHAKTSTRVLVEALSDKSLRLAAVNVLGMMGSDAAAATPALVPLKQDENPAVRAAAALALARIGTPPKSRSKQNIQEIRPVFRMDFDSSSGPS